MQGKHFKKKRRGTFWEYRCVLCGNLYGQSGGNVKKENDESFSFSPVEKPHAEIEIGREGQPDKIGDHELSGALVDAGEEQGRDG